MGTLSGKIALVAGATRGTGRGIAHMLGAAGATVYCTGRSTRANRISATSDPAAPFALDRRPETIEETAELVTAAGGHGIAVAVDHSQPEQVAALLERIEREQGRLDILVNDIWGGDELTSGQPAWQSNLADGLLMIERGVHTHITTAFYAAPLLIKSQGLLLEITDGNGYNFRVNLFYDFVKTSVIRLAFAWAVELAPHGVTAMALTPGFLRSEAMLDHFGVTEENWQDAVAGQPDFAESETPLYIGQVVAALAADPDVRRFNGQVQAVWDLAPLYGIYDVDGRQPHFMNWLQAHRPEAMHRPCDAAFYAYWQQPHA